MIILSIVSQTSRIVHNSYNCVATTNFAYNSTGSINDDAGWFSGRADAVSVSFRCGTLNATDMLYRIEGRNDTYTNIASIAASVISTAETIDHYVVITPKFNELRVGVKVVNDDGANVGPATPNSVRAGFIYSELI